MSGPEPEEAGHRQRTSRGLQNAVIGLGRSVLETSPDVLGLKIGIVFEDFFFGNPGGKEIQHVHHTDAHPPDAGASAALPRVERDSIHVAHAFKVNAKATAGEPIPWDGVFDGLPSTR